MRISGTILLLEVVLSSSTAISSNFITASPATETGSNHIRSRSLLDEDINDAVSFEIAGISSSDGQQEGGEEDEEPQGRHHRSLASIGGDMNNINADGSSNSNNNPNISSGNSACTRSNPDCTNSPIPVPEPVPVPTKPVNFSGTMSI